MASVKRKAKARPPLKHRFGRGAAPRYGGGFPKSWKRLRHGYGVHAAASGVPLNLLRKWMSHARTETTAIYANALGAEEQGIAARM